MKGRCATGGGTATTTDATPEWASGCRGPGADSRDAVRGRGGGGVYFSSGKGQKVKVHKAAEVAIVAFDARKGNATTSSSIDREDRAGSVCVCVCVCVGGGEGTNKMTNSASCIKPGLSHSGEVKHSYVRFLPGGGRLTELDIL